MVEMFKYSYKMNVDDRVSFAEPVHIADCGQVHIDISKRESPKSSIATMPNEGCLS